MSDSLADARKLAEKLRFSRDSLKADPESEISNLQDIKNFFYQSELRISEAVTPKLHQNLLELYERLKIPNKIIEAFVYPSSEIQAECHLSGNSECVLRFSSALIEILNEDEFCFVAGHEIGHFLLQHGLSMVRVKKDSLESFIIKRAQEISADRVGLVACGSIDTAMKALMKTMSGLGDHHIRFDIGAFLSQIKHANPGGTSMGTFSTHPTSLIRARALFLFSLDQENVREPESLDRNTLDKLDNKINRELDTYIDGPANKQIQEAKDELAMWITAYKIVQDGKFSKEEQHSFSQKFGNDMLEKFKNYIASLSKSEAEEEVNKKMTMAKELLEELIPYSIDTEVSNIHKWIGSQ